MFRPLILALSLIFLTPTVSYALEPIVQCGFGGTPCTACDFFALVSNAIRWLVALITLVITLVVAWAGIKIATSAGNAHAVSEAKKMFTNAIIGFVILLCAWLVVDTIIKTFTNNDATFGRPWNTISVDACKGPVSIEIPTGPGDTGTTTPSCEEAGDCPSGEWQSYFGFQSGINRQTGHVSSALNALLSCMAGTLQAQGYTFGNEISSISDSGIVNGSRTFQQCAQQGGCAHSRGSCHYGGASCWQDERSYAVDFGNNGSPNKGIALMAAARSCGAGFVDDEGDHIHVSARNNCGSGGGSCH